MTTYAAIATITGKLSAHYGHLFGGAAFRMIDRVYMWAWRSMSRPQYQGGRWVDAAA